MFVLCLINWGLKLVDVMKRIENEFVLKYLFGEFID